MTRKIWNKPSVNEAARNMVRQANFARRGKRSYTKRATGLARSLNPLPSQQTVSLRYIEGIDLAPGAAGAPAKYVWRCNGAYDPNYTGVGHQPLFWDTYAAMYNHYVVTGAKIRAHVWGENVATTYGSMVAIKIDDDGTTSSNIGTMMELKDEYMKVKMMRTNAGASGAQAVITSKFSAKKFFGLTNPKDDRSNVGALTNTNPNEGAFWVLLWQHIDASTTFTGNLKGYVTIDYTINFSEPRDISAS